MLAVKAYAATSAALDYIECGPGPEHDVHAIDVATGTDRVLGRTRAVASGSPITLSPDGAVLVPREARTGPTEVRAKPDGGFPGVDPIWHYGYLFSPALTLGGGTFAVQRNIVAEQVLGLPREPDVEHGMAWTETRTRKPSSVHEGPSSVQREPSSVQRENVAS